MKYSDPIEHYRKDAEYFDYFKNSVFQVEENRRRYETLFHLIRLSEGQRVLELGSGGSPGLAILKRKKVHYIPVDLSENNLKILNNPEFPRITPCCSDACRLPFSSGSIDIVILSEVLEHIENPPEVIHEIDRVLKPDGFLGISVPFEEKIRFHTCIHCNRLTPENAHLHSFSLSGLLEILNQCGFTEIRHKLICNKVLNRLHIYRWMKPAGYFLWNLVDSVSNSVLKKPATIVLSAMKAGNRKLKLPATSEQDRFNPGTGSKLIKIC